MAIRQWARHQRPREKLLIQGAKALSNAELLAICLRTGALTTLSIHPANRKTN